MERFTSGNEIVLSTMRRDNTASRRRFVSFAGVSSLGCFAALQQTTKTDKEKPLPGVVHATAF